MNTNEISNLLGDQSEYYLEHTCKTIEKSLITRTLTFRN